MTDHPGLEAISQISRSVGKIDEARQWYESVLGLRHLYSFGNLAFFDCGGVRLFLVEGSAPGTAESMIYFKVPDIRRAHVALVQKGVEFLREPHLIHQHADGTQEWLAEFNDPEGRPLAIHSCQQESQVSGPPSGAAT